jgi:predicted site-specific integrase-resolvase
MQRNGAVIKAAELESVSFAADRLGISTRRIYQMFREGKLDYFEVGDRKMVHRRDIERMFRERERRGNYG